MVFSFRFGPQAANAWALSWFVSLACGVLIINPASVLAFAALRHAAVWHFANHMVHDVVAGSGAEVVSKADGHGLGALAAAGAASADALRDQLR